MAQRIRKSTAQQIVETVKDVSGFDINFIDRDGIIFASTDLKRVGDYHEIGFQVVKTGKTIEVEYDDAFLGTHRGVNLPFVYRGEAIAAIGITGVPDEVRKYVHLALRITALILREQELDEQRGNERARLNYIIRALTSGEPLNMDFLKSNLNVFGLRPDSICRTLIVRRDTEKRIANVSVIDADVRAAFEQMGTGFYTFTYPGDYVAILEARRFESSVRILRSLAADHPGVLKIGIGSADKLTRQDRSYEAASIALRSLRGEYSLAVFDELDLDILLGNVPESARRRFLEKTAANLTDADRELLTSYFSRGMSLKAVSEELFMHKNTIQYKLDRIARETGRNPRVFKDAVVLYLALKLMEGKENA